MGRSSDATRSTVRKKVCTWEAHSRTCASFNGALPTLSRAAPSRAKSEMYATVPWWAMRSVASAATPTCGIDRLGFRV